MNSRINMEKAQKTIALVMEKIKAEVDPWLLDEYHILFKKEVSLLHRSRVAAYLLMLVEQGKGPRSFEQDTPRQNSPRNKLAGRSNSAKQERDGPRRARGGNDRHSEGSDPQRYPLADKDSKWLFFSVGRSRRVSPREILSLLNTKIALPKDDVGAIRIFDNYSFVQIRETVAETIIETLNGYVFRGRPLTVNYAKSRKDEEEDATEENDAPLADESPAVDLPVSEDEAVDTPEALDQQGEDESQEKDI